MMHFKSIFKGFRRNQSHKRDLESFSSVTGWFGTQLLFAWIHTSSDRELIPSWDWIHFAVGWFSSIQSLSRVQFLWPHSLQHARLPCASPTPGAGSNSCPLSWWCHPTISSSVIPLSSCRQSSPASGSFPMSQFFFASRGQSIGASASASVLPMNTQDWVPLRLTGLISCLSKEVD